jgi:hypothetical protein
MPSPPRNPAVDDVAPTESILTAYDQQHAITYLRLLDAEAEGADWKEVARIVLRINPAREPERARRTWQSHLARARWMTEFKAGLPTEVILKSHLGANQQPLPSRPSAADGAGLYFSQGNTARSSRRTSARGTDFE